ncbi:hypothetical protein DXG01_014729, partial [Tephrocybe rancida]
MSVLCSVLRKARWRLLRLRKMFVLENEMPSLPAPRKHNQSVLFVLCAIMIDPNNWLQMLVSAQAQVKVLQLERDSCANERDALAANAQQMQP